MDQQQQEDGEGSNKTHDNNNNNNNNTTRKSHIMGRVDSSVAQQTVTIDADEDENEGGWINASNFISSTMLSGGATTTTVAVCLFVCLFVCCDHNNNNNNVVVVCPVKEVSKWMIFLSASLIIVIIMFFIFFSFLWWPISQSIVSVRPSVCLSVCLSDVHSLAYLGVPSFLRVTPRRRRVLFPHLGQKSLLVSFTIVPHASHLSTHCFTVLIAIPFVDSKLRPQLRGGERRKVRIKT